MPKIILKNKSVLTNAKVRLVENADSAIDIGAQTGAVAAYDGIVDICLAPAPNEILCDGALNRTPIIEVTGSAALAIGSTGEWANYNTPEELITALEEAGLVVDIVPEEPFEGTTIYMANTVIDESIPFDGTKSYKMNVTLTKDGVDTAIPFNLAIGAPFFTRGTMETTAIAPLIWFSTQLVPLHSDIRNFITSSVFDGDESSLNNPKLDFIGNSEIEVRERNIVKLTFMPATDLGVNELDMYADVFGEDYPNGVTLISYGELTSSNLGEFSLSKDNKTLVYRTALESKDDVIRTFNPDMTYSESQIVSPASGNENLQTGEYSISDDGKIVVGVIQYNNTGMDYSPLYGFDYDNGAVTILDINWGEYTKPNRLGFASISSDNRLIVASGSGNGEIVFAIKDASIPYRYNVIEILTSTDLPDATSYLARLVNDSLLIVKDYYGGEAARFSAISFDLDYDAGTMIYEVTSSTDVPMESATIYNHRDVVIGTHLLTMLKGKLIHVDFTDINAITQDVLFTDPLVIEANGEVPGTTLDLVKVNGQDKLVYTRILNKAIVTIYDIDTTTITLSNAVVQNVTLDTYNFGPFSRDPAIFCSPVWGRTLSEVLYKVEPDNTLSRITVPFTP